MTRRPAREHFQFTDHPHDPASNEPTAPGGQSSDRNIGAAATRRDAFIDPNCLLEELFDRSHEGVIIEDKEGYILQCNQSLCDITGYDPEELIGQHISFLAHPDEQSDVSTHLQEMVAGQKYLHRVRTVRKNGDIIHVRLNERFMERDGCINGILCIVQDITVQVQAEEQLAASERRYHNLIDHIPDGVIVHQNGKIVFLNPAALSLSRADSEDDILGKSILDFVHSRSRDLAEKRVRRVINDHLIADSIDEIFLRYDGSMMDVEVVSIPITYKGEPAAQVIFRDVTEQKAALNALIESENRYRSIFDHAKDYILIIDPGEDAGRPRIVDVNQAACSLYGYSREELLALPALQLLDEPYRERALQIKSILQKSGPITIESIHRAKDGHRIPVEASASLVRMNGRDMVMMLGRDTTERRRALLKLQESERTYRELFDNASDTIFVLSTDLKVIDVNQGISRLTGKPQSWFIDRHARDILAPGVNDPDEVLRIAMDCLQNGSVRYLEIWGLSDQNAYFPTMVRVSPGRYFGQDVLFAFVMDISEKKQAQQEIRRLATLVEQASDQIVIMDLDGKIRYANGAYCAATGLEAHEVYNQKPAFFSDESSQEELSRTILNQVRRGEKWTGEIHCRRQGGTEYPARGTFFPIRDGEAVFNMGVIIQDMTREHELTHQLQQTQKMEAIGTLSGGVAHDFNNLLTAISGHAEIGLLTVKEDDPVTLDLNAILGASKRAARLTSQLLAFSRKQIYKPVLVKIDQLLLELEQMLKRLIPEDIRIIMALKADNAVIKADPGQIEQIVINLVVNARDALQDTPTRSRNKKITITSGVQDIRRPEGPLIENRKEGPQVSFSVSDNGMGMDEELKSRIFEPFFTTKDVDRGTGLGLATVYGIIQQNNADIQVDSRVNQGTTFTVLWPREANEITGDVQEPENKVRYHGTGQVLLVEDDPGVMNYSSRVLRRLGYTVYEFNHAGAALVAVQEQNISPSLLITDIIMPGMNGSELAEALQWDFPEMAVLYISGYSHEHLVRDQKLPEGVHFLQKPFTVQALTEFLQKIG